MGLLGREPSIRLAFASLQRRFFPIFWGRRFGRLRSRSRSLSDRELSFLRGLTVRHRYRLSLTLKTDHVFLEVATCKHIVDASPSIGAGKHNHRPLKPVSVGRPTQGRLCVREAAQISASVEREFAG